MTPSPDNDIPDRELVDQYAEGNVHALEILFFRYHSRLAAYVARFARNRHETEEIIQETWFHAIRSIRSYSHSNFAGWLARIAHNLLIDHARKKTPDLTLDVESESTGRPAVDNLAAPPSHPADAMDSNETARAIAQAILQLPPDQREVFLLRVNLDVPFKEIARLQRIPINTALARMHYATARLRKILAENRSQP